MWGRGLVIAFVGACGFSASLGFGSDASIDAPGNGAVTDGSTDTGGANGTCSSANQRVCVDATTAGFCSAALTPVADRPCPPTSMCSAGHCAPPPSAGACVRQSDCSGGMVCDLYVVSGTLKGFCTPPIGAGGMFSNCMPPGNSTSCSTGLCAIDGEDVNHRQCYFPCQSDSDCGGSSCHNMGTAIAQPKTIEGVMLAIKGCFQ